MIEMIAMIMIVMIMVVTSVALTSHESYHFSFSCHDVAKNMTDEYTSVV